MRSSRQEQLLAGLQHELSYLGGQVLRAERDWLDVALDGDHNASLAAARLRDLRLMRDSVRFEIAAVQQGRIR